MVLKLKKYNKFILILIIIVGTCTSFKYIYNKYNIKIQESKKIEAYLYNNNYDSVNRINDIKKINSNNTENYKFIIEIPKIDLKKGVYEYKSKNNDVNKNIYLHKNSTMPDTKNSNLILASHSGNSSVSYFKNLNELIYDDEIIIYYLGYKYIYKVNNIYRQEKTGTININRNINYNSLILITCDRSDKNYQLVYIAYLYKCVKF